MIGYAFCGSFCTFASSFAALGRLIEAGEDVQPIFSERAATTDTRFCLSSEFVKSVEDLCGRAAIKTVQDAEPLGPKTPLSALVIAPLTGNTLAKLANGITDTAVTMAAKAHLRTGRPLLLALASNDAMSANLGNIGTLLNRKSVYFVPLLQDDVKNKPSSLVCRFSLLPEALAAMRRGEQLRPLFL